MLKLLRHLAYREELNQLDKAIPSLDNLTRWNSTYTMVKSVFSLREFMEEKSKWVPELLIKPDMLVSMQEYLSAHVICYDFCIKMQGVNVSCSDFYIEWLLCVSDLEAFKENFYAEFLANSMKKRSEILFKPFIWRIIIFFDPRYKTCIGISECDQIKQILTNINNTNANKARKNENAPAKKSSSNVDIDYIKEEGLKKKERKMNLLKSLSTRNTPVKIHETYDTQNLCREIDSYYNSDVVADDDMPPLRFWVTKQTIYPTLYELSSIFLCIPPTQVSVERSFSSFNFIYSDLRCNLDQDTLEKLIFVKLNR